MSISERLKEERQRLGLSQSAFAGLAQATKSAQIKWEREGSSAPTAPAFAAWAEAGADVLYILTGRRSLERPDNILTQIEDQVASIRRDLLEPDRLRWPDEAPEAAEKRILMARANALRAILSHDTSSLTNELQEEVKHLLDAATNPATLSLLRAADFAQHRARRRELKEQITSWFNEDGYVPGDGVAGLLTTIALDYHVPVKLLVELVEDVVHDSRNAH